MPLTRLAYGRCTASVLGHGGRDGCSGLLDAAGRQRTLNSYGFRINHLVHDGPELADLRRRRMGSGRDGRRWAVHHDPYDISRVWVRHPETREGITVFWRHLGTAPVPMGELAWDHARRIVVEGGPGRDNETAVSQAAADLLNVVAAGPEPTEQERPRQGKGDRRRNRRVAARTRATAEPAYPRPAIPPRAERATPAEPEAEENTADVIPLGLFDPRTASDPGADGRLHRSVPEP
ncbi:Mu transposase C-terminal domain-containing protein [Streptomyces sp. NPDC059627]